jgi:hypothetical protein
MQIHFWSYQFCEQNSKSQQKVQTLIQDAWNKHHNYPIVHGEAQNA